MSPAFSRISIVLVGLLLASGCRHEPTTTPAPARTATPATTRSAAEPEPEPELAAHWQAAVSAQAQTLAERFPEAVVHLAVVDVAQGRVLASAGPLDEPHSTGSTIKPFAFAAALAAGVDPAIALDCAGGRATVAGTEFRDYAPHGTLSLPDAMARSSNVAVVRLAEQVGVRPLYERTAALVPLPSPSKLGDAEAVAILFGGTSRMTTRELLEGYAMLARGGVDARGDRRVDAEIARSVWAMLEHAVAEGTGTPAAVPGVAVAGKTGTAEHPEGYTAVFVGLARPTAGEPVLVAVALEGVPTSQTGSSLAAPTFAAIVREGLGGSPGA